MEHATLAITKQKKRKQKIEYVEGSQATKTFEKTMKALFRIPKVDSKKPKKGRN